MYGHDGGAELPPEQNGGVTERLLESVYGIGVLMLRTAGSDVYERFPKCL